MTTRTSTRKATAAAAAPKAIPPDEYAIECLEEAREALERALANLLRIGRTWEAGHIQTSINDIDYRHLPWARLTACTACRGFRDGDVYTRASKCVHVEEEE